MPLSLFHSCPLTGDTTVRGTLHCSTLEAVDEGDAIVVRDGVALLEGAYFGLGGSSIRRIELGTADVGAGQCGATECEIAFGRLYEFDTAPHLSVTPVCDGGGVYAATVTSITRHGATVSVARVDNAAGPWEGGVRLNWVATAFGGPPQ